TGSAPRGSTPNDCCVVDPIRRCGGPSCVRYRSVGEVAGDDHPGDCGVHCVLSCLGHAHLSAVSTARDVVGHRDTGECAGRHHGVVPRGGDRTPLTWMSLRLELPKSFPTVMSCFARCCGPPSIRMEGRV